MQVKGITANAVDNNPGVRDRAFQLNLDGQEITQQVAGGGFGQPRFSREAIAEFQVITNLFDITQGRSLGIQVQAISRSGTNNLDGAVYGYFRDDKLNAKDFIANRVLPYANQQIGAAVGGPIVRDKLHYFLSYERENEPNTILTTPPALAGASYSFDSKLVQNSFLGRGRLAAAPGRPHHHARGRTGTGATRSPRSPAPSIPSQAADRSRKAFNVSNTWAKVLNDSTVQEVRVSFSHFDWKNALAESALDNTPNYVFPGLTVGRPPQLPAELQPEHLQRALRPHLERRRARPEGRRRVPALERHRVVGTAVARRVHLHSDAGRPGAPLPGRRLERPDAVGPDRPRRQRAALRPELRRLDHRHPAADHRPVDRRHLEDQQLADHQRRPALGRRLRRPRPAAHHHPGHLRSARRAYVPDTDAAARRPALSRRPARHQQHRAARRLHLERRRQGQLRRARRQRPLLQHPRLEHHLQPPVVQRRAHPGELVPERRPARVHRRTRPAASPPTTSSPDACRCRRSRRA